MKKLPIGIQSIERIRTENYIYVDKTQFALALIEGDAPHYFLSRPRRFGKSLFLRTLEEIFKGNNALFEGCRIAQSNYDWQPYPVLLFDFSGITNDTTEELNNDLRAIITNIGQEQGIDVEGPSLKFQLTVLVKALDFYGLCKRMDIIFLIDSIISHTSKHP